MDRSTSNRIALITFGILVSIMLLTSTVSAGSSRYLKVNKITMKLDGPDATFIVDYELDIIAKIYVLFLGSGNIEPAIHDIFYNFKEYEIVNLRDKYAVVVAKNVSYKDPEQEGNFYFHDAHDLGVMVETFDLVFPSGVVRTFTDISSTTNTFFEQ